MDTDNISVNRKLIATKRAKQLFRNYNRKKNGIAAFKKIIGTRKTNKLNHKLMDKIVDQYDGIMGYILNTSKKQPYLLLIYSYVDYHAQRTTETEHGRDIISDTVFITELLLVKDSIKKDTITQSVIYTYHAIKRMLERCEGYLQLSDDEFLSEIMYITMKVMEDFNETPNDEFIESIERKMEYEEYTIIYKLTMDEFKEITPVVVTIYPNK